MYIYCIYTVYIHIRHISYVTYIKDVYNISLSIFLLGVCLSSERGKATQNGKASRPPKKNTHTFRRGASMLMKYLWAERVKPSDCYMPMTDRFFDGPQANPELGSELV